MNNKKMAAAGLLALVFTILPSISKASLPWPGEAWQQSEILTALDNDFVRNLSGAHWNSETRTLWVCVNSPGKFLALVEDGAGSFRVDQQNGQRGEWTPAGDIEGIAQADLNERAVYTMNEGEDLIKKYDTSNYGVVRLLQAWNISDYVPTSGGYGSEGLAFVPDFWLDANGFVDRNGSPYTSQNGMGGLMFVAHQNGGGVYVFDLNPADGTLDFVGEYMTSRAESSGLEFDRSNGKLFIWHNINGNHLEVTDLTSAAIAGGRRQFHTIQEYNGPKTGNLEGVALTPVASREYWAFFTDDDNQNGAALMWFQAFVPDLLGSDFYEVSSNTTLAVDATEGLLKNDVGLATDVILTNLPSHGTLTGLAINSIFDGSFEYVPNENFAGTDSFTYKANNGIANSEVATVRMTVKPVVSFETRVSSSADDAEENNVGTVNLTSTDLELTQDTSVQTIGMRFNAVHVPAGAVITRAYLQFVTDEISDVATNLAIKGEAVGNSNAFQSLAGNISSRPTTAASVNWTPSPWAVVGEAGASQRTPNLAGVIQELVNIPGWQEGNSLTLIITGQGKRVAKSYNGNSNQAPLLHVEYDSQEESQPTVQIAARVLASADDAEESSTGAVTLSSTDLELIKDGSNQKVGIRFSALNIPAGAEILDAYIQFAVDETLNEAATLTIQGQSVANAPAFVAQANNISSRARTAFQVLWAPNSWNRVGDAGTDQRTPDLSGIVQEIVNRADWATGNSMVLIITGTGKRVAKAFDGDRNLAPMLFVEYAP